MKKFLKIAVSAVAVGLLSACAQLMPESSGNTYAPSLDESLSAETSMSEEGIAMNGYDPVHMLTTRGEAVVGEVEHAVQFLGCDPENPNQSMCHSPVTDPVEFDREKGGIYLFASAENKEAFLEDPPQYTPKYGGFCGWGVVDYRDTSDSERPLNVPHATPTPPISKGGVYAVFGEGDEARIIGFYNEAVYERFLVDPGLYESTADVTWEERRSEALVPWNAVADSVRTLKEEQAAN